MDNIWKISLLPLFGVLLLAFPIANASTISSYNTGSSGGTSKSTNYSMTASSVGNIGGNTKSSGYSLTAGWVPGAVAGNGFDLAGSNLGNSIITYINGVVSTITIPNTVVNPTINFDNILVTGGSANTVTLSQDLTITSALADFTVQIVIPGGTTISGPTSWNGVIKLPVELPPSEIILANSNINEVIFLGIDGGDLTFSQPVKVTFFNEANKLAGFMDSTNTITPITITCNADNLAAVSAQLSPGDACKINNVSDLDIWTTHFTTIFTYTVGGVTHRVSGGQASDIIPPTLGGSMFKTGEYGLTIDNNTFALPKMTNIITPTNITVGKPVHMKLLIYENSGPSYVKHVGLYIHLTNKQNLFDSDTYILWEPNQAPIVHDPNDYLSSVIVIPTTPGDKLELDYTLTFAKAMPGSAMIIRAWDVTTNSFDTHILDALNIMGSALQNNTSSQSQPLVTPTPQSNSTTTEPSSWMLSAIQDWGGYSSHPIPDSEFLKSLNIKGNHIPHWVTTTTKWVVNGSLSPDDFINMLTYLSESGILK